MALREVLKREGVAWLMEVAVDGKVR